MILKGLVIAVLLSMAGEAGAEPRDTCKAVKPTDKGYRVLVQTVAANNANALSSQKLLGMKQTPITKSADAVDVVRWCRCVEAAKIAKFGEERTRDMTEFKRMPKYLEWMKSLPQKAMHEHTVLLWTIDAECFNAS